jgi:archaellum component FlaG (FlaF/FlaG flagellin family)
MGTLAIVGSIIGSGGVQGLILLVDAGQAEIPGERYQTIQAAIDYAETNKENSTIQITAGTYTEDLTFSSYADLISLTDTKPVIQNSTAAPILLSGATCVITNLLFRIPADYDTGITNWILGIGDESISFTQTTFESLIDGASSSDLITNFFSSTTGTGVSLNFYGCSLTLQNTLNFWPMTSGCSLIMDMSEVTQDNGRGSATAGSIVFARKSNAGDSTPATVALTNTKVHMDGQFGSTAVLFDALTITGTKPFNVTAEDCNLISNSTGSTGHIIGASGTVSEVTYDFTNCAIQADDDILNAASAADAETVLTISPSITLGAENLTTYSTVIDGGNYAWFNPTSASAEDSTFSTASSGVSGGSNSDWLRGVQFVTGIPSSSILSGAVMSAIKQMGGVAPSVQDGKVQLYADGVFAGDDKADTVTEWPPNLFPATITYGSSTDSWGLDVADTLSSIVNAADFGCGIEAFVADNFDSGQIDHMFMQLWFSGGLEEMLWDTFTDTDATDITSHTPDRKISGAGNYLKVTGLGLARITNNHLTHQISPSVHSMTYIDLTKRPRIAQFRLKQVAIKSTDYQAVYFNGDHATGQVGWKSGITQVNSTQVSVIVNGSGGTEAETARYTSNILSEEVVVTVIDDGVNITLTVSDHPELETSIASVGTIHGTDFMFELTEVDDNGSWLDNLRVLG